MPNARAAVLRSALLLFVLACFLRFPDTVAEAALDGAGLAYTRVLPALFPFSVAASVLFAGTGRWSGKGSRFSPDGVAVLLSGWVAGFPLGASGAARLWKDGALEQRDAERLAAASSAASPAFLVGAVGGMWGDSRYGILLVLLQWLTLGGYLLLSGRRGTRPAHAGEPKSVPSDAEPFARLLSRSIAKAAEAALTVTASIAFFRVLAAVAARLLPPLGPVFALLFEFSSGARAGAAVGGVPGAAMTGIAVGFSGLSVLTQAAAALADTPCSLRSFVFTRILLAAVLGAGSAVYAALCPMMPSVKASTISGASPVLGFAILILSLLLAKLPLPRKYFPAGT